MASIAFDTLQFARRLKKAGVPEQQAETQAELMGEAFGFYVNDLVTRDYLDARLDARFAEFEARIERRLTDTENWFDDKLISMATQLENRFSQHDALLTDHSLRLTRIENELRWHRWLLIMIAASTVLPAFLSLANL